MELDRRVLKPSMAETPRRQEIRRGGILGGMGPLATADFLRQIVLVSPVEEDQAHIPLIVYSNPQIPDRTASILMGGESPVPALLASARILQDAGAEFIAIPCVSAHCFFDDLQAQVRVEILHLVREMLVAVTRAYPGVRRVGLLATSGTISSGLVQAHFRRAEFDVLAPIEYIQRKYVMDSIYGSSGIKAIGPYRGTTRMLRSAAEHLMGRGAELILIGCTEISLAFRNVTLPVPAVDALNVLARAVVREAYIKDFPDVDPERNLV